MYILYNIILCMYVCMLLYICVYVHMYIQTYEYMDICMYIRRYICVYVYIYLHVHILYVHIYVYLFCSGERHIWSFGVTNKINMRFLVNSHLVLDHQVSVVNQWVTWQSHDINVYKYVWAATITYVCYLRSTIYFIYARLSRLDYNNVCNNFII